MGDRTFVVIFFFWAALTIITPTLVVWSESSKPYMETNGQSERIKDRRLIGYGGKQYLSNASISSTRIKAAVATIEHHNWSWFQELKSLVCKVFQKAMGLYQHQLNSIINLPSS